MKEQLLGLIALGSDEDVVTATAKAMRLMFEALLLEGFTRDEAMQLVIAHGMGVKINE